MEAEEDHDPERGGSEMNDILSEQQHRQLLQQHQLQQHQQNSGNETVEFEVPDPHEELERILGGGQLLSGGNKDSEPDYGHIEARNEDCMTFVKNEIAQRVNVSNEESLEKLQDVAHFVQDHFQGQVQTLLMYDEHQRPFITVNLFDEKATIDNYDNFVLKFFRLIAVVDRCKTRGRGGVKQNTLRKYFEKQVNKKGVQTF